MKALKKNRKSLMILFIFAVSCTAPGVFNPESAGETGPDIEKRLTTAATSGNVYFNDFEYKLLNDQSSGEMWMGGAWTMTSGEVKSGTYALKLEMEIDTSDGDWGDGISVTETFGESVSLTHVNAVMLWLKVSSGKYKLSLTDKYGDSYSMESATDVTNKWIKVTNRLNEFFYETSPGQVNTSEPITENPAALSAVQSLNISFDVSSSGTYYNYVDNIVFLHIASVSNVNPTASMPFTNIDNFEDNDNIAYGIWGSWKEDHSSENNDGSGSLDISGGRLTYTYKPGSGTWANNQIILEPVNPVDLSGSNAASSNGKISFSTYNTNHNAGSLYFEITAGNGSHYAHYETNLGSIATNQSHMTVDFYSMTGSWDNTNNIPISNALTNITDMRWNYKNNSGGEGGRFFLDNITLK